MVRHSVICAAAVAARAWGMSTTLAQAQNFEGVDSGFPAPFGESSVLPQNVKLMRLWELMSVLISMRPPKSAPNAASILPSRSNLMPFDMPDGDRKIVVSPLLGS